VTLVAGDFEKPNGLAFSPDESMLYIADTGASHIKNGPKHIRRFKVSGTKLSGGDVFLDCDAGFFDGFRVDRDGRIWSSAGDGVHCFEPGGALIGKIRIPEIVGNVCFGGPVLNRLFMCGTTSLYSCYLAINGISPVGKA
jgi:gluconolactonase